MLTDAQREAITARLRRGRENLTTTIQRRPAGLAELPLSHGQEQLWFIDRLAPGLPTYNIPFAMRLSGPLHPVALRRALVQLTARHEALRTRLVAGPDGRPVQVIDPPGADLLELTDLSGQEAGQRQAALRELIAAEALRPFLLAVGPLLRTWLVRLAEGEHMLVVVMHHTVTDGWSAGVFVRELTALYAAEVTGAPSGLSEPQLQFADYAVWERERLRGGAATELEDYWRDVMAGFSTVQLPTDRRRPVVDNFAGARIQHLADTTLLDGLRALGRREGATLFVTLLAGLYALVSRYTGQTDLVFGTASANRTRAELTGVIGYLINTLPIRVDLSGDPDFAELLTRVAAATTGAYAHQDLPFARLVDTLQIERDPSRSPVFQIAMTPSVRPTDAVLAAGVEFAITDLIVGIDAAKFDLDIFAEPRADGLWLECTYKTALFDPPTIQRLLGHYETLLRGVVADPSLRLSRLPVLTEAELHRELREWNATDEPFDVLCIHEAIQAQVAAAPDAVAAEFEDQRWRYAELNAQANRIARRLREQGVGPETLVGVCMRAGLARLASLLAVWKAGGGYVPLDPGLPAERLSFMLADTQMSVVLTDAGSAASLPPADGVRVLSVDAERERIDALDDTDLASTGPAGTGVTPSNVAYVIYTSGSTGAPKGVVIEHRHAVNFLQGMAGPWRIGPGSAVLAFAAFTFDVSVSDMFLPLLHGGRVVMAPAETLHSPPRLAALIRDAGVTFACLPPAVLSLLTEEDFPGLRTLVSAGEELTSDLVRAWLRDGLEFFNGYGPTEATMGATLMRVDRGTQLPPPIGLPKPNYRAYVLDPQLNPVPVGVTGELHIGGPGVGRGYLNRPELTMERFIPDPFSEAGGRLYKTGDLARRRPDGTIVFVGRMDDQVKIRGLRVELGEIEAAMTAHQDVAQAVVTVVPDPAGVPQLAGYLRARDGCEPDIAGLRQHLGFSLPTYMVPAYLTVVAQFPLNANGKVDKAALPPVTESGSASRQPPATLIEAVLADMFASLLGRDQVGATDSFFDLGGNSLQAMRLISMLDDELEVDVGAVAVFLAPSPRQLAAVLRDKHGLQDADLGDEGPAEPRHDDDSHDEESQDEESIHEHSSQR